jgi:hypothetical protein
MYAISQLASHFRDPVYIFVLGGCYLQVSLQNKDVLVSNNLVMFVQPPHLITAIQSRVIRRCDTDVQCYDLPKPLTK